MADEMPDDKLGLPEAWGGSIYGLRRFIGFIDSQMNNLKFPQTPFPPGIAAMLGSYARDTERLKYFLDGYLYAKPEQDQ